MSDLAGIRVYDPQGRVLLDSSKKNAKPIYEGSIRITGKSMSFELPFESNEKMYASGIVVNSTNNTISQSWLDGNHLRINSRSLVFIEYSNPPPPNGDYKFIIYEF